jgi:hypothetical protein
LNVGTINYTTLNPPVPADTLGAVLTAGNIASQKIDMNGYVIENVSQIDNPGNQLTIGTLSDNILVTAVDSVTLNSGIDTNLNATGNFNLISGGIIGIQTPFDEISVTCGLTMNLSSTGGGIDLTAPTSNVNINASGVNVTATDSVSLIAYGIGNALSLEAKNGSIDVKALAGAMNCNILQSVAIRSNTGDINLTPVDDATYNGAVYINKSVSTTGDGTLNVGTIYGQVIRTSTGSLSLNASASAGTGTITLTPKPLGNLIFQNLPTSAVGLPTGAVWNNLGVLSIAP